MPNAVKFTHVTDWGGQGTGDGKFSAPWGVAVDAHGNIFVADTDNHRVQKLKSDGSFIHKWGGPNPGTGDAEFNQPRAIAVDADGNVLVADWGNNVVKVFDNDGNFVRHIGQDPDKGPLLSGPVSVAVSRTGNVYVVDFGTSEVIGYTIEGYYNLFRWGGIGSGDGKFVNPSGIAVDQGTDDVYVVDANNFRVQRFNAAGGYGAQWGQHATDLNGFSQPFGVAVDGDGSIYVVDREVDRVTKFSRHNNLLVGFIGNNIGSVGDFSSPSGVAVAPDFTTYVADSGNHRIRVYSQGPA